MAVLAAGGATVVIAWPSATPEAASGVTVLAPDPNPPAPEIEAQVDTLDIAPADDKAESVDVPQRSTERFSLLGISWTDPKAAPRGAVEVRTHSVATGKWTAWQTLETGEGGADGSEGGRGATEPMWVGPSDGVAARIAGGKLPRGLRLDLVDPGEKGGRGGGEPDPGVSETPSDEPTATPTPSPEATSPEATSPEATSPETTAPTTDATATGTAATTAPTTATTTTTLPTTASATKPTTALPTPTSTAALATPLPNYVSRAQWSADERLVTDPISVASEVRVLFVHHTAETNDYSCADSPKIVRAIQSYHVKSNGWSDIGYNFLVDKCGTLFEGRKGGVTNAVIGAHTYGFNTNSAGIAVLGNYSTAASPPAAELTIAQVAAARLGAYGHNPNTTAQLTEGAPDGKFKQGQVVTFQRVSGHRDGVSTECPGNNLYARLPSIRALALNVVSGLTARTFGGGSAVSGVYYTRTAVTANWQVGTPSEYLARFEVLVDGKVAKTAPASARSAAITLTAGTHTIAIRAVHISGATATTSATKVVADATAPTLVAPAVALRGGAYSTTYAPVIVAYRAADNVKVSSLAFTAPTKAGVSPTSTSWNTGMRPGAATTFTVTAKDYSGNARTATVQRKTVLTAETSAKRTGTWSTRTGSAYLSGKALAATKANTKLSYAFSGRSVALLFSRGAKTGKAHIYLDGRKLATIDTKQSATAYRQALWTRTLTPGKHTVMVVVAGTSGRPTVVSDGLAYIP
ncbi:peptidoglycan recognition protein [Actinoplanes sp. NPDC051513]|uniref:peptidoglycan recognition protein n=1 Tax=Actinoplanes sp. NPDC051513 TaxID=3363908 RepID=UPI0037A3B68A